MAWFGRMNMTSCCIIEAIMYSGYRRFLFAVAPCVLALALACGGGGGGGTTSTGGATATTPTTVSLNIQQDATDFNVVRLGWSASSSLVDGYRLYAKQEGGTYQALTNGSIPGNVTLATLTFNDSVPERLTFWFKVTAEKSGATVATTEASYRRSLRPAYGQTAVQKPDFGAAVVSWTKNSQSVADGFFVERRENQGTWTQVGIQSDTDILGNPAVWDAQVAEGTTYDYRIVPTFQGEHGMAVTTTLKTPPPPPTDLTLTTESAGALRLNWINHSDAITSLRVIRRGWNTGDANWSSETNLVTLGPAATTYVDVTPPSTGRWAYRVAAILDGSPEASSPWVLAGGPSNLPDVQLGRTVISLPFRPALRDADGGWMGAAWSNESGKVRGRILRSSAAPGFPHDVIFVNGPATNPTINTSFHSQGVGTLDFGSWEELGSFGGLSLQVHRLSGGVWQSTGPVAAGNASFYAGCATDGVLRGFAIDSTFVPRMMWADLQGMVHSESLASLTGAKAGVWSGPGGTTLCLAQTTDGWAVGSRDVDGNWTFDPISELSNLAFPQGECRGAMVDSNGDLRAIFTQQTMSGLQAVYMHKAPGLAAVVETVLTDSPVYWIPAFSFACSSDGNRVGFAVLDDAGLLRVALRAADGAWTARSTTLPDAHVDFNVPFLRCGFLGDGRFWVLHDEVNHPDALGSSVTLELLEEPMLPTPIRSKSER